MDYSPVNLAPKGVKQGDYFTTTLGPYDYWAIEYAYKPLSGGTEGEVEKLQKIASRVRQPGHDYGTDEDTVRHCRPAHQRLRPGRRPDEVRPGPHAAGRGAAQGPGRHAWWTRARATSGRGMAFSILLAQYGNGAHLVANFVGGEYMHRDHRGDPNGRDPFVPVKAAKQREALKFLQEHILSDQPFQFPPELLRRLAADRWSHWGNDRVADQPGRLPAPRPHPEHPADGAGPPARRRHVLARIQNNALKADKDDKPLTVAEVFRSLTDGIWGDLPRRRRRRTDGPQLRRRSSAATCSAST